MNADDFKGLIDYLGCDYFHKHYEGLVFCSHSKNPDPCEGNCNFESCPLQKTLIEAKEALDNFDPFFREEDYDL
jgi:hypothetical protein